MRTLEELRTPGLDYVYHRPLQYPDISAVIYCPVCHCEKSGDINEPNIEREWCDDGACRCHQEPCDDCGLAEGHDLSVEH